MLALATSLLFISQVSAGLLGDATQLVRREDTMEEKMKRYVDSIIEPMERRQTATGDGKINVTAWDIQTAAACTAQLSVLNGTSSNPSGLAVCYNIPFLDNTNGVFEADLRLYMVAAPTGDFANIASSNVQVGLSYSGATVSAVNASTLKRRSDVTSLISWPRDEKNVQRRAAMTPMLVQSYAFVGQINKNILLASMGTADLEKALTPTVTLTGQEPTGQTVNTTLSSDEATFVSGIFAEPGIGTKAQVAPPMQTLVVAPGAPFVVPGLNILIYPVGGIITGIWTVLFIATLAYGTIGRMQFREQYRRRSARANETNTARI